MKPFFRLMSAALACGITLSACGSGSGGAIRADLDEFSLDPSRSQAAAGAVQFEIQNLGAVAHEFIVLRSNRPSDELPTKGGFVRVTAEGISVVRSIKSIKPGDMRSATVRLQKGRYALICNIVGHYQSGMSAPFRVT